MTLNGALYPRNVVHKLYVARTTGERGLIGWEDCVRIEERCVKNEEELLIGVTDVDVTEKDDAKSRFDLRRELKDFGVQSWMEKKKSCYIVKEMLGIGSRI